MHRRTSKIPRRNLLRQSHEAKNPASTATGMKCCRRDDTVSLGSRHLPDSPTPCPRPRSLECPIASTIARPGHVSSATTRPRQELGPPITIAPGETFRVAVARVVARPFPPPTRPAQAWSGTCTDHHLTHPKAATLCRPGIPFEHTIARHRTGGAKRVRRAGTARRLVAAADAGWHARVGSVVGLLLCA